MMYKYEEQRAKIVTTEEGLRRLMSIKDKARELIDEAGAVRASKLIEGDAWLSLGCIDYLVEADFLIEVTDKTKCFGQDRIFVAKK